MKIHKFEDLKIWQVAMRAIKVGYDLSTNAKFKNDFTLQGQFRKSLISISSNVVEGFEKNNNNEFIRFLKIAKGSNGEALNQLHIAHIVEYISRIEFDHAATIFTNLASQIGAFITYLERARASGEFIQKKKPVNSLTR